MVISVSCRRTCGRREINKDGDGKCNGGANKKNGSRDGRREKKRRVR